MQVLSINSAQSVYQKRDLSHLRQKMAQKFMYQNKPTFRGDTGAALGIFGGAAVGALTAAAIVATGGLAAPVAAIGATGVIAGGAGCCTHIGGIIGSIIEDKFC